jgi:hypothetical protein
MKKLNFSKHSSLIKDKPYKNKKILQLKYLKSLKFNN